MDDQDEIDAFDIYRKPLNLAGVSRNDLIDFLQIERDQADIADSICREFRIALATARRDPDGRRMKDRYWEVSDNS